MKRYLLIAITSIVTIACATSPTGRSQFLLMSDNDMAQMGVAAFTDMKSSGKIDQSSRTNQYVTCVAAAITKVLDAQYQRDWEVVVFEDESANAFALPGGKIGVHTGLLKVAVNQHQLASVMGHEVGHVMAHHGNERMSLQFASQSSQQLLGVMLQNNEQKPLLMAAMGVGVQFGLQLPYSRSHESEADLIGLDLMAKAGFKPEASVELWKNMGKNSKGAPPEFMSTHPSHSSRIDNLTQHMPAANTLYRQAQLQGNKPNCQP
ncbi:M48 family metallopeptidase [Oceanicoccus sp. KOV_DT_Chl]|uniref:M48 family metallopeptidase n=1 Tax=Oceanicoccus sp. KOV_DT_Chl TaxID=1904639 RepID=UPI000C7C4531|nr:M48 family metallopeptidase [Oceanicoccus sp. KOV_DT_Chl]